jgi:hypothetical protein
MCMCAVAPTSYQMDMEEVFAGGTEKTHWPVTPYTIKLTNHSTREVSARALIILEPQRPCLHPSFSQQRSWYLLN